MADALVSAALDTELADFIGTFYDDPLGFVRAAYPWQEPNTPLADYAGPDEWQTRTLEEIGRQVKARKFDGVHPTAPIRIAISSGHGIGKAHPVSLPIDTPLGPQQWGDIAVGDYVFGVDGRPVRVAAVHAQGAQSIYRVQFDDGTVCPVTSGHLWAVRGRRERRNGLVGWRTLSTMDLSQCVTRPNGRARARQWEIPIQGAAEFPGQATSLHPYVMGLWLGDGIKGQPSWSKPYQELVDRVRGLGYVVHPSATGGTHRIQGVSELFKAGVFVCGSPDRYIPSAYLRNDIDSRRELLSGLLDSDGEVHACGSIGYATTSKTLAHDIAWLVRSLGGKATHQPTVKDGWYPGEDGARIICRPCHRITIQLDWNPFTLEHRRAAYKPSEHRYLTRWIDSIGYSHEEEAMCVTVEAADGLYLANDFIVTHNSTMQAWLVDWIMSTRPECRGTITANTNTQLDTKTWAAIQRWTRLCLTAHWFEVNTARFYRTGERESWFCAPQSSKEENSEAFAGQHAANSTSFYVIDEGSAVPDVIYEVAEGGLTDGEPMIFVFGNPTRSHGMFHRICFGSLRERWSPLIIDSRDATFTNKTQIAEWIQDYGEDSDFVRVRVRGLPPAASDLQFISTALVSAAQKRQPSILPDEPLVCGLDVARGGQDRCVFRFRRGTDAKSIAPLWIPGEQARDSMRLVTMAADVLSRSYDGRKVTTLFVDGTGIGGPIVDRLRQMGHHNAIEVQFGGESPNPKQANMRAYMWSKLRDWLPKGCIDADSRLEMDLTAPGYHHDKSDRLVLESKEHLKDRGIDSPDDADALALTFAMAVSPTANKVTAPYRPRGVFT